MLNRVYELNQNELEAVSGGLEMPLELGIALDVATGVITAGLVANLARIMTENIGIIAVFSLLGSVAGFWGMGAITRLTKEIGLQPASSDQDEL